MGTGAPNTIAFVMLASALACGSADPPRAVEVDVLAAPRAATPGASAAGLPVASVLLGPCVPIPERAFRIDRIATQASPPDPELPREHRSAVSVATDRSVDIDGDGQADALVPEPAAGDCNHDVHRAIYVARGTCGHRVGVVVGSVAPRAGAAPGVLADLTTTVESGHQEDPRIPAQRRTITRTYRFDGTEYREVDRKTQDAVCHHCSSVRCTAHPL